MNSERRLGLVIQTRRFSEELDMSVKVVLAGVAVENVDAALPWYERLFGRPADALPMEGLAEWRVPSGGVVQLVASPERGRPVAADA